MATFLIVHGVLHLAIWLPPPSDDPDEPPPFHPDRSAVLTAVAPAVPTRQFATSLAAGVAVAYAVAAAALAAEATWTTGSALVAACLGLLLKSLFFHPWLSVGVLLDLAVLVVALAP